MTVYTRSRRASPGRAPYAAHARTDRGHTGTQRDNVIATTDGGIEIISFGINMNKRCKQKNNKHRHPSWDNHIALLVHTTASRTN